MCKKLSAKMGISSGGGPCLTAVGLVSHEREENKIKMTNARCAKEEAINVGAGQNGKSICHGAALWLRTA